MDTEATPMEEQKKPNGYCRLCGKPVYNATADQVARGMVYCEEHSVVTASPYDTGAVPPLPGQAVTGTSPGLAFLLGLLPGVGAVYNGQYAKGLIHAITFGFLISVADSPVVEPIRPVMGLLVGAFYFYMPFEALHTARRRAAGLPMDEFSGLIGTNGNGRQLALVGPAILIALGMLLLLGNLNLVNFEALSKFWPVLLIALGAYLLYVRVAPDKAGPLQEPVNEEVR